MILIEAEAAEVEAETAVHTVMKETATTNGDTVEIVQDDIIIAHLPATAMIATGIETGATTNVIASGRRIDVNVNVNENENENMIIIVTASSEVRTE